MNIRSNIYRTRYWNLDQLETVRDLIDMFHRCYQTTRYQFFFNGQNFYIEFTAFGAENDPMQICVDNGE